MGGLIARDIPNISLRRRNFTKMLAIGGFLDVTGGEPIAKWYKLKRIAPSLSSMDVAKGDERINSTYT
jgi:hypothetical protein